MKIALVSREFPPTRLAGGIATYTQKTARMLAAGGHEVHVYTEAHAGAPHDEVLDGVAIQRLRNPGTRPRELRFLQRAYDVALALRRNGPYDLVQACEWEGEAALYARFPRSAMVTRLATPRYLVENLNDAPARDRRRSAVVRALERWQTLRSTAIISPSRSLAEIVARDWEIDPDRIRVVPTGIQLPPRGSSAPPPDEFRSLPYVLYFGRLEVRKGVETWLRALRTVLPRNPELHAVFAGDDLGIEGTSFKDLGARLLGDYSGRLHFLRRLPQSELFPLIAGARLVVLPSRWESLANACLEAMALGRPVVATEGSGFAEVIEHDRSGWLVPPDDAARLAETVNAVLTDPLRLEAVAEGARRRAEDYSLDRMVRRLLDVYQEVLGGSDLSMAETTAG